MAATKATGIIKGFEWLPPLRSENFSQQQNDLLESMYRVNPPKQYAVVTPNGEISTVLCEIVGSPSDCGFNIGSEVSYLVEGSSAKFGTQITKIS